MYQISLRCKYATYDFLETNFTLSQKSYTLFFKQMSTNNLPILYVKSGCPWCREALSFFNSQGVNLDVRDVNKNAKDMDAMVALSGQTKAPTFEYEDFIVADFDVDEFLTELSEFPGVRKKLGISDGES